LTGYEEKKIEKYLNNLEDEEKDFISDNVYNIITTFEESNFILANSNYSIKLSKLFNIYNINHFSIYNNDETKNNNNNLCNNASFINNYYECISPLQKFYIDMMFRIEMYNEIFYQNENKEILIYNKSHEHIYNLKLIEFYIFIKTLNAREKEKEKEFKTIDTDDQSKIIENSKEELPITEKFIKKLELSLIQNKDEVKDNNKYNDISIESSYLSESIIREYDEDKIKICKNFKCNYGIEKEKKPNHSRNQRYKKILQNANKELEDTYDNNYVKKKFNKDITIFNPEKGKIGVYKDILQKITLEQ
jgi:hypothetical protein